MGQYWKVANLDKREFIDPHKLGVGLKLGEQIGSGHGTPDALFILVAAMRECRGGGDFDWDSNYYGPERDFSQASHGIHGADVVVSYNDIAKRTIGRWAGDRIVVVGDYSEDGDLPSSPVPFGTVYERCADPAYKGEITEVKAKFGEVWTDITEDVAKVIEHEVGGTYQGDGWKDFIRR